MHSRKNLVGGNKKPDTSIQGKEKKVTRQIETPLRNAFRRFCMRELLIPDNY